MMDFLPFTVAASGNSMKQPATGRYVRYLSNSTGSKSPAIEVRGDKGGRMLLLPGQSGLLNRSIGFEALEVRNYNNVADITGVLAVGDVEEFQDDSRISGEVSCVDGSYSKTLNGDCYVGSYLRGGVAAEYGAVQLWNPADSAVDVVVEQVMVSSPAATFLQLRSNVASLGSGTGAVCKLLGGAASSALIVSYGNAALPGSLIEEQMVLAYTKTEFVRGAPIVVPPGVGLIAVVGVVNVGIAATFHFFKRPYAGR